MFGRLGVLRRRTDAELGSEVQLMFMKQPDEGCEILEEGKMRCGA